MKKALIIVNYNDSASAVRLADTAEKYECLDRIYIVDNCSTDQSQTELLNCEGEKISLIQTGENRGYSFAMNQGCRAAVEELGESLLLLSNSDIEVKAEKELQLLFQALENGWDVVGPVIHQQEEQSRGWKLPQLMDDVMMNIPFVYRIYEKKKLLYPETHYKGSVSQVDAVSGSFFGMRSDFWQRIGGFDEGVFLFYEENILGAQAKALDRKIGIVNGANVIHQHSVSVDRSMMRLQKYDRLKQSQRYYEVNYNHISGARMLLLEISVKITRFIYCICGIRG